MSSRQHRILWGAAFALTGFTGGQNWAYGEVDQDSLPADTTGINLVTAAGMAGGTDVTQVEYEISRVACIEGELFSPLRLTVTEEINAMQLPGGIAALEDQPLDAESAHSFADHFEALPPGCYDVQATPLQADGDQSMDCEGALENDVLVEEGHTTEIFLMGQCGGVPLGGLDAVMALNQPPSLQTLDITPSKFIRSCQKTTVCATAADPDNDPIELVWREVGGTSLRMTVVFSEQTGGEMTECVEIQPSTVGHRSIEVRAYDLVHDPVLGLIRAERWLQGHGSPTTSHATLRFPLYVGL